MEVYYKRQRRQILLKTWIFSVCMFFCRRTWQHVTFCFFLTINDTSVLTRFDKDLRWQADLVTHKTWNSWNRGPFQLSQMVEPGWMADRSQESYCSLAKVTVRGDDEPLLYRGELTLQGIDKAAAVSYCPLIVRSTPWLLITIQKWLIFFFWSHFSSFEIVQRHFSVGFYS